MNCKQTLPHIISDNSLNGIGDMNGLTFDDNTKSLYGAVMKDAIIKPTYYEYTIDTVRRVPWLGKYSEDTFMNNTKRLNEDPVVTYRDYKLMPIPQSMQGKVKEEFNAAKSHKNMIIFIVMIIILIIILFIKKR